MALVPRDNSESNLGDHTTDKYMLKEQEVLKKEDEFDIRMNRRSNVARTLGYIYNVFTKEKTEVVKIRSYGAGLSMAVKLAEVVKTKVKGLHQINRISNVEIEDIYIPLEEGLDEVKITKQISVLEIELTKKKEEGIESHHGYQEPLGDDKIEPFEKRRPRRNRRKRMNDQDNNGEENERPERKRRNRGRLRDNRDDYRRRTTRHIEDWHPEINLEENRLWKVTETEETETVSIQVDLSESSDIEETEKEKNGISKRKNDCRSRRYERLYKYDTNLYESDYKYRKRGSRNQVFKTKIVGTRRGRGVRRMRARGRGRGRIGERIRDNDNLNTSGESWSQSDWKGRTDYSYSSPENYRQKNGKKEQEKPREQKTSANQIDEIKRKNETRIYKYKYK